MPNDEIVLTFLAYWFAGFLGGIIPCLPLWFCQHACRVANDAALDIRGC